MAFDLVPLGVVQAALADREIAHFVGREKRLRRPIERQIGALRPRLQILEAPVRQDAGLVGLEHHLQEPIQFVQLLLVRRFELLGEALVTCLAIGLEKLGPLAPELALRRAPDERVAVTHQPQIGRVQFLRLDEHLLAHADLAKVVQQGRIADLFQLFARERHVTKWTIAGAVDDLREPHGHPRHASAVTIRRDRKSTRLNSSHVAISYAVFCLKKKKKKKSQTKHNIKKKKKKI